MELRTVTVDTDLYTEPGFFFFWMPVRVPYKSLNGNAEAAGFKVRDNAEGIYERGKMFGRGWIGIPVEDVPDADRSHVRRVQGEFKVAEHVGSFSSVGKTMREIKRMDRSLQPTFMVYPDDPHVVPTEQLRTWIYLQ